MPRITRSKIPSAVIPGILFALLFSSAIFNLFSDRIHALLLGPTGPIPLRPSPEGAFRHAFFDYLGINAPDANERVFAFFILIGLACLVLLAVPRTRRAWPEIWIVVFLCLAFTTWMLPPPNSLPPNSPSQFGATVTATVVQPMQHPSPVRSVAISVPADKVPLEDLKFVQPDAEVAVIVVGDRDQMPPTPEPYHYTGRLIEVLDVNGVALKPPYWGATIVRVLLPYSPGSVEVIRFTRQASHSSAIYILPLR